MPNKLIINCTTGERTEVELTEAELVQRQVDADASAVQQAERDAETTARAAAKATATTKLKALGLTDAEIATLI